MNLRPPGYEPGELPGCSTPRRGGQYTSVDAVFWAALGFLIAAIVVGTGYVGVRARRLWQASLSLALVGAAGADMVSERSGLMAVKADRAVAGADELLVAVDRLERSKARGRVLLGAVEEMFDTLSALGKFIPQK